MLFVGCGRVMDINFSKFWITVLDGIFLSKYILELQLYNFLFRV